MTGQRWGVNKTLQPKQFAVKLARLNHFVWTLMPHFEKVVLLPPLSESAAVILLPGTMGVRLLQSGSLFQNLKNVK